MKIKKETVKITTLVKIEYDPTRKGARDYVIETAAHLHINTIGCSREFGSYFVKSIKSLGETE